MAEYVKDLFIGMPWYLYLLLVLCFGLLVASFIVPPLGTISPSALQGAAEILGFTWLFYVTANIPVFIERGAKIKASWKDATIEIGRHKKKDEEDDKADNLESGSREEHTWEEEP